MSDKARLPDRQKEGEGRRFGGGRLVGTAVLCQVAGMMTLFLRRADLRGDPAALEGACHRVLAAAAG